MAEQTALCNGEHECTDKINVPTVKGLELMPTYVAEKANARVRDRVGELLNGLVDEWMNNRVNE